MLLFFFIYFAIIAVIVIKYRFEPLCEPLFWIGVFWILILGVYFTSGVSYKYGLSFITFCFIIICFIATLIGRKTGMKKQTKVFKDEYTVMKLNKYLLLGILGTTIFIFEYIRLNGITETKADTSSSISIIGSIGSLLTPLLLLLGLYYNAKKIKEKSKFSIKGIILVFFYSIPCMISSGRESILFAFIGIICMYGYYKVLHNRRSLVLINRKESSQKKTLMLVFSIGLILFVGYTMLQISINRFTTAEINVLLTTNDVSSEGMKQAESWGEFEFLYYNIASYFSQQIPFLDFTLREYHGPYLFGMFELNIISRRLPDFLGLDYRLVFIELRKLFMVCGEDFGNGWNTILGSFITDFSWVGAIPMCWLCGYVLGKVKKKFDATLDIRYATLIALFCLSAFSTIQLGPFFQTQIYGTYLWWYLIFRKKEQKVIF